MAKRMIALLATVLMLSSMNACKFSVEIGGKGKDEENTSEEVVIDNEAEKAENEATVADSNNEQSNTQAAEKSVTSTTKSTGDKPHMADKTDFDEAAAEAEFRAYLEDLGLNADNTTYNLRVTRPTKCITMKFSLADKNKNTFQPDGKITIDGESFSAPIPSNVYSKAGWALNDNQNEVEYNQIVIGNTKLINKYNGHELMCNVGNNTVNTKIKLSEASVCQVSIQGSDNEPEVVFCRNLTKTSTPADVIKTLGYPIYIQFEIWYTDDGSYDKTDCHIAFNAADNSRYNSFSYRFWFDTNEFRVINQSFPLF